MRFLLPSIVILSLIAFSCQGDTQEGGPTPQPLPATVFPSTEWERASPAALGVDSLVLDSALTYLERHCQYDGLEETMVIRNGYLLWAGDSINKVHDIWSCTKSFVSTAVGILAEEGKLKLEDTVANYEPLLREHYPAATFRHFLTMTSGYNAVGQSRWGEPSEDWSLTPYAPDEPLFAPGTAYAYWDEAMIMLGRALTRIAGEPLNDYLAKRVLQPIGIPQRDWWGEGEVEGIPINFGGTGLRMSASDQARFGWLFLNEGQWNRRPIVSGDWTQMATVNQVPSSIEIGDTDRKGTDGRGIYGYNWWVINAGADAPVAGAFTSGLNHNVCLLIPDWNMVVVRMGVDGNPELSKHQVYSELIKRLAPGVNEHSLIP